MSFGISVFSSSRTRSGIPLCDVEKAGPRITSGVTKGGWQGQVSGVHSSLSGSDEKIESIHASVTASAVGGSHFGLLALSTIRATASPTQSGSVQSQPTNQISMHH